MKFGLAAGPNRSGRFRFAGLLLCGLFVPFRDDASPVTPLFFDEISQSEISTSPIVFPDEQEVINACGGVPFVLCGNVPTSHSSAMLRTRASAFTDGLGGSGLSLSSQDRNLYAVAGTVETGRFHANSDIEVRLQAFFPVISLFAVFSDDPSEVDYSISVAFRSIPGCSNSSFLGTFCSTGVLTRNGFATTGPDLGAVYDGRREVTVPPFFLDMVLGTVFQGDDFELTVEKKLSFHGVNTVEIVDASIIDPFGVSAPGIVRNGLVFTEVGSVPEPGTVGLTVIGLLMVGMPLIRRGRSRFRIFS